MHETPRTEGRGIDWRVYVILDPEHLHPDNSLMETARAVLAGGAGLIQLRDKQSSDSRLLARARRLAESTEDRDAVFIVNDRVDIALASGADGVHVGPEDLPVKKVRSIAPDLIIGASAGEPAPAMRAKTEGADYIGCGAIYGVGSSKPDASEPRGPAGLEHVVDVIHLPVIGIGGIDPENAGAVMEAGAAGVAVIRSVVGQANPEAATRRLYEAVS